MGIERGSRRGDLVDCDGARRDVGGAAGAQRGQQPRASRVRGQGDEDRRPGYRWSVDDSRVSESADSARGGQWSRGDPPPAGTSDRRARRTVRSLRHEHARRIGAGVCRLSPHIVRRLAVAGERAGARARRRTAAGARAAWPPRPRPDRRR